MSFYDAFMDELEKLAIEGTPLSKTLRDAPWYQPSLGGRRNYVNPFRYMEGAKELRHVRGRLRNLRYTSRQRFAQYLRDLRKKLGPESARKMLPKVRAKHEAVVKALRATGESRKFTGTVEKMRKQFSPPEPRRPRTLKELAPQIFEPKQAPKPRPAPKAPQKPVPASGPAPGPTPKPTAPAPKPSPSPSTPPAAPHRRWLPRSRLGKAALIGIPAALGTAGIAAYLLSRKKREKKNPYEDTWEKSAALRKVADIYSRDYMRDRQPPESEPTKPKPKGRRIPKMLALGLAIPPAVLAGQYLGRKIRERREGKNKEMEKKGARRRSFGIRTSSRDPKRDIEGLRAKIQPRKYENYGVTWEKAAEADRVCRGPLFKGKIRPKKYQHFDESLGATEFIQTPAGSGYPGLTNYG